MKDSHGSAASLSDRCIGGRSLSTHLDCLFLCAASDPESAASHLASFRSCGRRDNSDARGDGRPDSHSEPLSERVRSVDSMLVDLRRGVGVLLDSLCLFPTVERESSAGTPAASEDCRPGAASAPPVVTAAAFIRKDQLTFQEIDVIIPGLPRDLNGLRIVQLSDIHLSPFVSERLLARSVDMANETKAHIALDDWRPDQPRWGSARLLSATA